MRALYTKRREDESIYIDRCLVYITGHRIETKCPRDAITGKGERTQTGIQDSDWSHTSRLCHLTVITTYLTVAISSSLRHTWASPSPHPRSLFLNGSWESSANPFLSCFSLNSTNIPPFLFPGYTVYRQFTRSSTSFGCFLKSALFTPSGLDLSTFLHLRPTNVVTPCDYSLCFCVSASAPPPPPLRLSDLQMKQ
jgi:hypothetical protein